MANKIMTVVEGHVPPEQEAAFLEHYQHGVERPPQILRAYLARAAHDPTLWRTMAVWPSREAFEEYRRSVETPGGLLFFRHVGVEPSVAIFELVDDWSNAETTGS